MSNRPTWPLGGACVATRACPCLLAFRSSGCEASSSPRKQICPRRSPPPCVRRRCGGVAGHHHPATRQSAKRVPSTHGQRQLNVVLNVSSTTANGCSTVGQHMSTVNQRLAQLSVLEDRAGPGSGPFFNDTSNLGSTHIQLTTQLSVLGATVELWPPTYIPTLSQRQLNVG